MNFLRIGESLNGPHHGAANSDELYAIDLGCKPEAGNFAALYDQSWQLVRWACDRAAKTFVLRFPSRSVAIFHAIRNGDAVQGSGKANTVWMDCTGAEDGVLVQDGHLDNIDTDATIACIATDKIGEVEKDFGMRPNSVPKRKHGGENSVTVMRLPPGLKRGNTTAEEVIKRHGGVTIKNSERNGYNEEERGKWVTLKFGDWKQKYVVSAARALEITRWVMNKFKASAAYFAGFTFRVRFDREITKDIVNQILIETRQLFATARFFDLSRVFLDSESRAAPGRGAPKVRSYDGTYVFADEAEPPKPTDPAELARMLLVCAADASDIPDAVVTRLRDIGMKIFAHPGASTAMHVVCKDEEQFAVYKRARICRGAIAFGPPK